MTLKRAVTSLRRAGLGGDVDRTSASPSGPFVDAEAASIWSLARYAMAGAGFADPVVGTAFHEAAHGLVEVLLSGGRPFTIVLGDYVHGDGSRSSGRLEVYASRHRSKSQRRRIRWEARTYRQRGPDWIRAVETYTHFQGVQSYAGVCAQFPRSEGWTSELALYSSFDREGFRRCMRRFGHRDASGFSWRYFYEACAFVDTHWGAVEALAVELIERRELRGDECAAIVASAPVRTNPHRTAWYAEYLKRAREIEEGQSSAEVEPSAACTKGHQ